MSYDDNETEFRERFAWLRQCGLKENTAVDADAYWHVISDQPMDAIRQALLEAPRAFQAFFPSAGALRALVQKHARAMQPTQADLLPDLEPTREEPSTPALDPSNPFARLAREWEEESRRLRLDPDKRTPMDVARGRMAQIEALLDKHDIGAFPEPRARRRVA